MTSSPEDIEIDTARLRLRRFEIVDASWLHALDSDPDVMRWINGGEPVSLDFIRLNSLPLFMTSDPVLGFRAIVSHAEDRPIGWCCLRANEDPPVSASLGYRLFPDAWGMGYATEASRALLRFAFERARLEQVTATTYEENAASIRVLERLGFVLDRRFRVDLAGQQTAYFADTEPWPGDDLAFVLARTRWQRD